MFLFTRFILFFLLGLALSWSQNTLLEDSNSELVLDSMSTNPVNLILNEVVVTGQITEQSTLNSVNSFIVITNEEIKSTGSNNLSELLSTQAVFDIYFDPAIGSKGLKIQGMQGNNVNVLIDGVPVIGRKDSQIDLAQINLSNIERVEILKGPGSVAYGTNSTGGVINLISKKSINDQIQVQTYFESIGLHQLFLNLDKKIHQHAIHFNIGRYSFPGIDNKDADLREQEWRAKDQYFGDLHINLNLDKFNILLKKSLFNEKIIELGPEQFFPNIGKAYDLNYLTYRDNNYVKFNYVHSAFSANILTSYSTTRFMKHQYEVDLLLDQSEQTADELYNTEDIYTSFYNRLEFNYLNWKKINLQTGVDLSFDKAEGSKIKSDEHTVIQVISLFNQLEIQIGDFLKSQIGLRVPHHSMYKSALIPSFQFKFDINPNTQFRLSYAQGFRAPSMRELYMYFVDSSHNIIGNSNLNSETSNSFQSSLNYLFSNKQNINLSLNIEAFFNDLKNKITLVEIEDTDVSTYYNIEGVQYYGLNTTIKSKIHFNSDVSSHFTIMWNLYKNNDSRFEYKNPENSLSVSYHYEYQPCSCGLKMNWKMKSKHEFYRLNENDTLITDSQEGYQLLQSNLFKYFPKIQASLHFGIKNMLDVKDIKDVKQENTHSGPFSTISWGRTYFIQLNWHPF